MTTCLDCGQDLVRSEDGVSWEHEPWAVKCHTLVPIPAPEVCYHDRAEEHDVMRGPYVERTEWSCPDCDEVLG